MFFLGGLSNEDIKQIRKIMIKPLLILLLGILLGVILFLII